MTGLDVTQRFLSFWDDPADRSKNKAGALLLRRLLNMWPCVGHDWWRLILVLVPAVFIFPKNISAYTANKVWFEFRPKGGYRVYVNYTVPELKEFREAYVDFGKKAEAERYYWDLVRGADFYLPTPGSRRFIANPLRPEPW